MSTLALPFSTGQKPLPKALVAPSPGKLRHFGDVTIRHNFDQLRRRRVVGHGAGEADSVHAQIGGTTQAREHPHAIDGTLAGIQRPSEPPPLGRNLPSRETLKPKHVTYDTRTARKVRSAWVRVATCLCRSQISEPETISFHDIADGHRDFTGKLWAPVAERVKLAVLPARVDADG